MIKLALINNYTYEVYAVVEGRKGADVMEVLAISGYPRYENGRYYKTTDDMFKLNGKWVNYDELSVVDADSLRRAMIGGVA